MIEPSATIPYRVRRINMSVASFCPQSAYGLSRRLGLHARRRHTVRRGATVTARRWFTTIARPPMRGPPERDPRSLSQRRRPVADRIRGKSYREWSRHACLRVAREDQDRQVATRPDPKPSPTLTARSSPSCRESAVAPRLRPSPPIRRIGRAGFGIAPARRRRRLSYCAMRGACKRFENRRDGPANSA